MAAGPSTGKASTPGTLKILSLSQAIALAFVRGFQVYVHGEVHSFQGFTALRFVLLPMRFS